MWEKPYIQKVLNELERLGYKEPKLILLRYYRSMRRTLGFYLNANDFAQEIDDIHKSVSNQRRLNDDSKSIYIGHIRNKMKKK